MAFLFAFMILAVPFVVYKIFQWSKIIWNEAKNL